MPLDEINITKETELRQIAVLASLRNALLLDDMYQIKEVIGEVAHYVASNLAKTQKRLKQLEKSK